MTTINPDRTLSFDGKVDSRYHAPVWAILSKRPRIFFRDGTTEKTIVGRCQLEAIALAEEHHFQLTQQA